MLNTQAIVAVLVALIGSAGIIGAAIVTQVFGRKTQVPAVDGTSNDHFEQTGPLYQKIGRLEAELEDCHEDLKTERAK